MTKNIIVARSLSLALALAATASYFAYSSCSTEPAEPREIRAHTTVIKGVSHAEPHLKAERYCQRCHGQALQGGVAGEPSCYQCHGKTWLDTNPEFAGPGDHSVDNQGFHHLPGLFDPTQNCVACHGADLTGNVESGLTIPSCTLCHTKLWEERLPSAFY